jgi:hypothetical protein
MNGGSYNAEDDVTGKICQERETRQRDEEAPDFRLGHRGQHLLGPTAAPVSTAAAAAAAAASTAPAGAASIAAAAAAAPTAATGASQRHILNEAADEVGEAPARAARHRNRHRIRPGRCCSLRHNRMPLYSRNECPKCGR